MSNRITCWMCHKTAEELKKWIDEYKPKSLTLDGATELIACSIEDKKSPFFKIEVGEGWTVDVCPVCQFILYNLLEQEYFEQVFDEKIKNYTFKVNGEMVYDKDEE